ncbi:MAG: exo-alpha-sialidase [Bryobacteraceae bacterium]|nr:exo-alpha-sialidase [Bryobacteraceae bacterium]
MTIYNRREILASLSALAVPVARGANKHDPFIDKVDLFDAGEDGYSLYRIPGLATTRKGTVLAYCEARKSDRGDWGPIDIFLRRGENGGKSWSPRQKIADVPGQHTKNSVALAQKLGNPEDKTYNNPVAVTERKTGDVHFMFCLEYMRCFYMKSRDDGKSFSEPIEITSVFEQFRSEYDWKVLATGPTHGIELKNGRLLVPVWMSTGTGNHAHRPSVCSVIYSDDGGTKWQRGEIAVTSVGETLHPSETVVAELADGRVVLNVRTEAPPNRRVLTYSKDGASGWSKPVFHDQLLEPVCNAALVRLSAKPASDRNRLLFSNPDNLTRADGKEKPGSNRDRKNLSVKLSYDEGQSWPVTKVLEPLHSGYSDLGVAPDGTILCLYERGGLENNSMKTAHLTVARFNLEWLTDGKDSLRK